MSNGDQPGTSAEPIREPRPKAPPSRESLLSGMLSSTKRAGVPIRNTFVQLPTAQNGSRGSMLSQLVKTRSAPTLDAFLLIHALASSREPYTAWYPVSSWTRALGLADSTGTGGGEDLDAAKAQWSKLVRRLVDKRLVTRERSSNRVGYGLLDESGSGAAYVRPTDFSTHGHWFTVPHVYWRADYYRSMDLATKAMLLIALSSNDRFKLPAERVPDWYGLSVSTAQRGLKSLHELKILEWDQSWRVDAASKTGWAEVRTYYLLGEWANDARKAAMSAERTATATSGPRFSDIDGEDLPNAPEDAQLNSVSTESKGTP